MVLSEESASTNFSSLLKNCRKQSLFQSFLASAKILSDQILWHYSSNVVFNGLQKKCKSCFYLLSSGKSLLLQLKAAPQQPLNKLLAGIMQSFTEHNTFTWNIWGALKGAVLCKHSVMHRNSFCHPGLWHFCWCFSKWPLYHRALPWMVLRDDQTTSVVSSYWPDNFIKLKLRT